MGDDSESCKLYICTYIHTSTIQMLANSYQIANGNFYHFVSTVRFLPVPDEVLGQTFNFNFNFKVWNIS